MISSVGGGTAGGRRGRKGGGHQGEGGGAVAAALQAVGGGGGHEGAGMSGDEMCVKGSCSGTGERVHTGLPLQTHIPGPVRFPSARFPSCPNLPCHAPRRPQHTAAHTPHTFTPHPGSQP